MRHLDDGTLRRIYDEPLIVSDGERAHLRSCERCRERQTSIAATARDAAALFHTDVPTFHSAAALQRVHRRLPEGRPVAAGRFVRWVEEYRDSFRAGLGSAVAALALIGALLFTPAGSLAQSFITIFQPKQVTPLYVSSADLQSLPRLQQYGTVHASHVPQPREVPDAAAAAQATGMTVLTPSSLPGSIPASVTYQVVDSSTGTFTFNAVKAKRAAQRLGKSLPSIPAGINGSTLKVTTGAAVLARYGKTSEGAIPALLIGQMVAPTVSSTGVTVKELEDYVLSLPGVSPALATALRSINDPTSTLPIPIPVDKAHAEQVTIQGASGLTIGDATGLGSAVIWEKDGIIYGVGGPLPQNEVIDIARSLH